MLRQLFASYLIVAAFLWLPKSLVAQKGGALQKTDTVQKGKITGKVKDTALNYFIQSATVAVYNESYSDLLAYTLTNSFGEFSLGGLLLNKTLRVKISYIGYETFNEVFAISPQSKHFDLGEVRLHVAGNTLDSVVVLPPPVQMHGDTLEFSAGAFKLDSNAVAEDLLKRLPGIVIWGDGSITVNGRQISKLLVDGKPFFGTDVTVATQNIPKSSIEKVQVYQEYIDPNNPLDSITSINIKLRKGRHNGYFGALYAGESGSGKYDAGANNNLFSPRNQFAVVVQGNNVNKLGNDIGTLLRNNTFKGTGVHLDYQPEFSLPGINEQTSGGLLFSRDFIPDYNQYKQNRLAINSFFTRNLNNTMNQTQTTTGIGIDSLLQQNGTVNEKSRLTDFNFDTKYNRLKNQDSLMLGCVFSLKGNDFQKGLESELSQMSSSSSGILSVNNQQDSGKNSSYRVGLLAAYNHHGFFSSATHRLTNWSLVYSVSFSENQLSRLLKTDFVSHVDSSMNLLFDRKYDDHKDSVAQRLTFRLGDFSSLLFGENRLFSRYHIELINELGVDLQNQNNVVEDGNSSGQSFNPNGYLTMSGNYKVFSETPDLRIGRGFTDILANRYQKQFDVYVDPKVQFFRESNTSSHVFQDYVANYTGFVPAVTMGYSNFQYSEFFDTYKLSFSRTFEYPTPDQRVPLVDSANVYAIRMGNYTLKPATDYKLSFDFRHVSYRLKNTLNYGANIFAGIKDNFWADSLIVDPAGRNLYYTVNLNGNRYAGLKMFFNKAFILGSHQFQMNLASAFESFRNPGFSGYQSINSEGLSVSKVFTNFDSVSFLYTYKDFLAVNVLQIISWYDSRQRGFSNAEFRNLQSLTRIGAAINFTNRFSVNTNVSFNWSSYSGAPLEKYTIWNAYFAYRFLRANDLELKLSALDILNENKGIINYASGNSYSYGTVNLLHQYFMATISWFPRHFGKKVAVKP
jgi:hypothetical protein